MEMMVSRRDACTVTRGTGRLDSGETPYRNCMVIDCLTSTFLFFRLDFSNAPLNWAVGHACTTCSSLSNQPTLYLILLSYSLSSSSLAATYKNLNHRLSHTHTISRIHSHMHVPNIVYPRHAPKLDSIPVLLVIPPGDL